MRKYLIGFICGVLLVAVPISAAVEQFILSRASYKVVVNGAEYVNSDYPTLNYQGTTYIPLKKVADLLGVPILWNDDKGQAEIGASAMPVITTPAPTATPKPVISYYFEEKNVTPTSDHPNGKVSVIFMKYGDTVYIDFSVANLLIQYENPNVSLMANDINGINGIYIVHNITKQIIVKNIQTKKIIGERIDYNYFLNTVLPLIK